jgi:neutral ceramidase
MNAPSAFTAGIARREITPKENVWMGGFAFRNRPSESVLTPLWAKTLALADGSGDIALVLAALDRVSLSRELTQSIESECARRFGLPRKRLVIFCSHTHSGPMDWPSIWMPDDPIEREKIEKYSGWLVSQLVEAIGEACAERKAVTLGFHQGLSGIGVNRRRAREGCRHFPGPVDHDVPVLRIADEAGNPAAILFGYACHATALGNYEISGDWPGFACEALESRFPGASVFYVPGCGADINPLPRLLPGKEVALAKSYGEIMATAVETAQSAPGSSLSGPLEVRRGTADLFYESASAPLEYPAWTIRFGSDLLWIALCGEVVVDYSLALKARHGWDSTWVSAYASPTLTYFPSRRVWEEGGYEAGDHTVRIGHPSRFREDVETRILALISELTP